MFCCSDVVLIGMTMGPYESKVFEAVALSTAGGFLCCCSRREAAARCVTVWIAVLHSAWFVRDVFR